jgi:hypothetical protein
MNQRRWRPIEMRRPLRLKRKHCRVDFPVRSAFVKDGSQVEAISLFGFAQKLAGRTVDEMQPGAGLTNDGLVGALWIVLGIRQPMLHIQSGLRTFEDDMTHGAKTCGACRTNV